MLPIKRLKEPSIFVKFTIAFVIVGLIPIMILSYASLSTVTNQVEEYTITNYEEILDYSSNRIEDFHQKYNNITKLMYNYNLPEFGRMQEIVNGENNLSVYKVDLAIGDFLRPILNTDSYIRNVIFVPSFDHQPRYISRTSIQFIESKFDPNKGYQEEIERNLTSMTTLPVHRDDYFKRSDTYVLTFARNLVNTNTTVTPDSKIFGTIYIDVDTKVFKDIFSKVKLGEYDEIYVVNKDGYCIYSNKSKLITRKLSIDDNSISDQFIQLQNSIEGTDWKIIANFQQTSVIDKLSETLKFIHIVIFVTIFALLGVAILFSRRFAKPISKMTNIMKKVELGDMHLRMNSSRRDEIGLLANGFDKMLENLDRYINKVYVAQIHQKQAQLNALRSQIHPHYLYNSLEVIRMSAIENDDLKVADMIHYLSDQLKYIMEHGSDQVPLKKELNHVSAYLRLLEFRYQDKISHEIVVKDPELEQELLPKLSIQPLVENAFLHGILQKKGKGKILIVCEKGEKSTLKVSVLDDGVGINEEKVSLLNRYLEGDEIEIEKQGSGIGLKNVHDRLQELYGKSCGLMITSKPFIGTMVILNAPLEGGYKNV